VTSYTPTTNDPGTVWFYWVVDPQTGCNGWRVDIFNGQGSTEVVTTAGIASDQKTVSPPP
jgi:hypothetical protein